MVVETGKEIGEGEVVCSAALLAMNGGLDKSNVESVPLAEWLEKPKLVESRPDPYLVVVNNCTLGQVFSQVSNSVRWRNFIDPNRNSTTTALPSLLDFFPRQIGGDKDDVEVCVPVAGHTSDFDNHRASSNARFPESPAPELSERF